VGLCELVTRQSDDSEILTEEGSDLYVLLAQGVTGNITLFVHTMRRSLSLASPTETADTSRIFSAQPPGINIQRTFHRHPVDHALTTKTDMAEQCCSSVRTRGIALLSLATLPRFAQSIRILPQPLPFQSSALPQHALLHLLNRRRACGVQIVRVNICHKVLPRI